MCGFTLFCYEHAQQYLPVLIWVSVVVITVWPLDNIMLGIDERPRFSYSPISIGGTLCILLADFYIYDH